MFIDIHAHVTRLTAPLTVPGTGLPTAEQLLERHEELQIECAVLLPLIGPEVYVPQCNEDFIEMAERWPDRFVPFCNVDPRAISNSADAPLGDLLRYYRDRGCRGIGELMPNLPFLDPLVQNLFRHCEDVGFPLIFDISDQLGGDYGLYDDPGLPQLEKSLRRFPKLKILGHGPAFWAEIARLRTPADRGGYPRYSVEEEGVVPVLLRRYENLYGDLSAGSGYNALARDSEYAAAFLNEFQDKLLFGTDICSPEQEVGLPGFLLGLKDEGKLSEEAFEKIARGNARELLGL